MTNLASHKGMHWSRPEHSIPTQEIVPTKKNKWTQEKISQ